MRDRLSSLVVAGSVLFGLLLVGAPFAHAQGMYQVELMVFAYPAGGNSEQWDALPELGYPDSTRFLLDARDQGAVAAAATVDAGASVGPTATPAAFVLLPATQRELGAGAASMRGSGRYRILFHEAWVQPMPGKSTAIPIVLDHSGEGGAWPELQGSVNLYQAGDYFLETNLWLNTRGEYLPGAWRMPPPPRGPRPGATQESAPLDASLSASAPAGLPDESPDNEASDYPYRHAVLLQQTRRLRGGEVHYIDHPMLGVVAKVTPLNQSPVAPASSTEIPQPPTPAPAAVPTSVTAPTPAP